MGIFSMSNEELRERILELCKSDREFNKQLVEYQSERALCDELKNKLEEKLKDIAAQEAQLNVERKNLESEKISVSEGYVKDLKSIFKKERKAINELIKELDVRVQNFVEEQKTIAERENSVTERENKVRVRELDVEAGLPEKNKAYSDKLAGIDSDLKQKQEDLKKQEEALAAKEKELNERDEKLSSLQIQADKAFAGEKAQKLKDLNEYIDTRKKSLDEREEKITERENSLAKEIQEKRAKAFEDLSSELSERRSILLDRKTLDELSEDLDKREGELDARESELNVRAAELDKKEANFKKSFEEERGDLLAQLSNLKNENERRIKQITSWESLKLNNDQIMAFLGGKTPAEFFDELDEKLARLARNAELENKLKDEKNDHETKLNLKNDEIKNLEELLTSYTKERIENNKKVQNSARLAAENDVLKTEKASLEERLNVVESDNKFLTEKLERYLASYNKASSEAERAKEIEIPYITFDKIKKPQYNEKEQPDGELEWLNGVGRKCDEYGLHFNPRTLKSFHTALKTAEWSPITVLAGVSGTGKSELPRLYSHFGGFMFEPLSVQPNWDSQESMLGFFNSIDNKFDAQPVLRFLAQSQKEWVAQTDNGEGYPGLKDVMHIVLLDEMNLAHPEFYFSEFLSKLELRRGTAESDIPYLNVKMGAGLNPYKLPLGRNVLWAGTMNQDETTKSLSDKVIDRSIIIHFPRPESLKSRKKLLPLNDSTRGKILHRNVWESWCKKECSIGQSEIDPFKKFIEDVNACLEVSGRALGHRVWQSIEYYMANYPDVIEAQDNSRSPKSLKAALHVAFEDQLVQKVMPKLRGIDTRGKSKTDCLDKIRALISKGVNNMPFNLEKDFDIACEMGYGQFIWQSANYLNYCENKDYSSADANPISGDIPKKSPAQDNAPKQAKCPKRY